MEYRKVERIEVGLDKPFWNEISFSELKKDDIFRVTDLNDNGEVDGEDGKKIVVASSDPYVNDGVLTIQFEEFEGSEEDALTFEVEA